MSKLHSMLLNREIDLCITATNDFENWSGCKVVKYRTYPAKIMVSSKHSWSSESRVCEFDIAEDSIALLDDHKYLYPESLYRRIRTKNKLQVSDFNALIASLQMGKYFSISPEYFNGILDTKLNFFNKNQLYFMRFKFHIHSQTCISDVNCLHLVERAGMLFQYVNIIPAVNFL